MISIKVTGPVRPTNTPGNRGIPEIPSINEREAVDDPTRNNEPSIDAVDDGSLLRIGIDIVFIEI